MQSITIITESAKVTVESDDSEVLRDVFDRMFPRPKPITPEERESALETLKKKHPVSTPKADEFIKGASKKQTEDIDITKGKVYPKIIEALSGRNIGTLGANIYQIRKMTGLGNGRSVPNALFWLEKAGRIKRVKRWSYVKA